MEWFLIKPVWKGFEKIEGKHNFSYFLNKLLKKLKMPQNMQLGKTPLDR